MTKIFIEVIHEMGLSDTLNQEFEIEKERITGMLLRIMEQEYISEIHRTIIINNIKQIMWI